MMHVSEMRARTSLGVLQTKMDDKIAVIMIG